MDEGIISWNSFDFDTEDERNRAMKVFKEQKTKSFSAFKITN